MLRVNSLFARLLVVQAAMVLALALLVGVLFNVQRNVTLAQLYGDRWAAPLADAAGIEQPAADAPRVWRAETPPDTARRTVAHAPRFAALRQALAARGVTIDEVRVQPARPDDRVWLHVLPPGRSPVWLGVDGRMAAAHWSRRLLAALAGGAVLLVAVSWWFTRRLTQPLERLQHQLRAHTPGTPAAPEATPASVPEIAAVDTAYADLVARLHQHERERAVLLAGVSHDLRSPLGRIRMAAELLPDEAALRPRRDTIIRNVATADRLIGSFLDFVRSGELAFDEPVDLALVARSAVAAFDRPAAELSLKAPPSLVVRRANRLLVERLVANLIDNAFKHGRAPVLVEVLAAADGVRLVVQDAGPGLPTGQVEVLQEAFTRGDASRADGGTGLGLAIVKQVAQRLGGHLTFERDTGVHRVTLTLPTPPETP